MNERCWAVVPAAGVGRRMGGEIPKQYLPLPGGLVIELSLRRLLAHPRVAGVLVALAPDDPWWPATAHADDPRVVRVEGGEERCHSVLNALDHLQGRADERDWVLVHDAARPCLRAADLERLIDRLWRDPVGGLLGVPVHDTIKRLSPSGEVEATVPRERLWHAFTPQMFRLGALRQALQAALRDGRLVTDDASAMELAGQRPRLIEGHPDNLKITRTGDLELARFYLDRQSVGQ